MNIKFQNVCAHYKNNKNSVLKNINFEAKKGSWLAIVGPSGSGKTSIINTFYGDLKISTGSIFIDNQNFLKKSFWNKRKYWKKIGFVSQTNNLIDTDDVYTNIKREFLFPWISKKQKEMIHTLLTQFHMFEKIYTRIDELSGGQKQRVELIKLCLKNKLAIFLDEPTNNLDTKTTNIIFKHLKKWTQKHSITTIAVMHDLEAVKEFFDEYIAVVDGEIISSGPVKLLTKKELNNIYK
ncbi:ATP-binding cassette domain-containing protein [Mycoplasma phocoenae]|uniref:ATP-binding cassette domain-containing protein n=1 Tax=Mycoplasma phocoenae TaxID=754517 RepID=A0A858U6R0_9MOLU|nr:ATP-binding cassette domain-containing protein [Mycoplasma phocoenae]QJG66955.1 ATP-binding cassette domain-containing protein [Mycoplasma phocoenae]